MFESISAAPPDAILGLTEAFKADTNDNKINLGVGVYKNDRGQTPVLDAVKKAEAHLLATQTTKSYLPMQGAPEYGNLVQGLLFGADHEVRESGRAFTCHTPGGTGALRVGADFIGQTNPQASVWVSTPTWANHKGVFAAGGCALKEYAYYDAASHGVDFPALMASLEQVPAGDVVLLHVCCHNPTGVDLDLAQWQKVADLARQRRWIPFFDFAYQGFGDSVEEDREALRPFADAGMEFFVASSFSKNFGLYCERTGALTLVAADRKEGANAFSHVKLAIRTNYSNPPAHGGEIIVTILQDAELEALWRAELDTMRDRIVKMRKALVAGLKSRGVTRDFSFIEAQRGMFSFSGLNKDQVDALRENKSIYIVKDGRINVAGITTGNIDYLCDALAEVLG